MEVTHAISKKPGEEIRRQLISLVNELINKDFSSLLQLLYRIDVDEKKIRLLLSQNADEDAANIIADLIIERQLKKVESKKQFSGEKNNEDEEERW